jgi:hypothetical protein
MVKIDISKVLGHKNDTLLYRYCDKVINGYINPPREGVKKGDKIGSSFERNAAAVFIGLTNLEMQLISERSGISYASMRTWNTDEDFKKAQEDRRIEFAAFVEEQFKHEKKDTHLSDYYLFPWDLIARVIVYLKLYTDSGYADDTSPHYNLFGSSPPPEKDIILMEIDRYEHLLLRGVMRQVDKDGMLRMLSLIRKYIRTKC